jgi:hypothetical protein
VDPREIGPVLYRHRRRWWWPRTCRCGLRHQCGARQVALTERGRILARAVQDAYPRYFAGDATELLWLARLRDPDRWR